MKTIQLIFIAMFISFGAKSQDFIYEGPAKSEVRSFWTNAMGIQRSGRIEEGIAMMEAKLAAAKQKDPAYKTDKMEAELKKWKDKALTKKGGADDEKPEDNNTLSPLQKSVKAGSLMRTLFDETNIGLNPSDVPVMEIRFKQYNDKLKELLALNTKPNDNEIRYIKGVIGKMIYNTNQDIGKIEIANEKANNPEYAGVYYYLTRYHQLYWDAAQKVFPDEAEYADEYKTITAQVNKNGSLEDMKAGRKKNNEAEVKARKLPSPVVRDAAFEKLLVESFDKSFTGRDVKALKGVLTQDGWTTLRNSLTGVILGRERSAKIAYKKTDGKCYLLDDYVFIKQEYIGGSFTNTKVIFNGLFGSEMLCENVK